MALRLRSSSSSYAPLTIWETNWRFDYDLCEQVAICLRSERIATDLCASESTDGDLGDHGDQLETNQRSISALEDLSALRGAFTERHRSPPSRMGVLCKVFLLSVGAHIRKTLQKCHTRAEGVALVKVLKGVKPVKLSLLLRRTYNIGVNLYSMCRSRSGDGLWHGAHPALDVTPRPGHALDVDAAHHVMKQHIAGKIWWSYAMQEAFRVTGPL